MTLLGLSISTLVLKEKTSQRALLLGCFVSLTSSLWVFNGFLTRRRGILWFGAYANVGDDGNDTSMVEI
jgi:hypothetical protein